MSATVQRQIIQVLLKMNNFKVRHYLVALMVFAGVLLALIVYYKFWEDKYLDYISVNNLIGETFLPFYSINLIFWGELIFSKSIFDKSSVYLKEIVIFFIVQLSIGAILIILHSGYWIDYFRNDGIEQYMLPKYQKIDFLTSSLIEFDTELGLCLLVSSIIFFVQLLKK